MGEKITQHGPMRPGETWVQPSHGDTWPEGPDTWPERPRDTVPAPPPSPEPSQRYFRGVAAVPQRRETRRDDTDDFPAVVDPAAGAPRPRRWRTLRKGGGWTMAGLWFTVICWGIWAISGQDLTGAGFALGLVLAIAALVFSVSRLLGRVVLESTLGRSRPSAWPSHLSAFLLLTIGGLAFLQQTPWINDAWRWLSDNIV